LLIERSVCDGYNESATDNRLSLIVKELNDE